MAMTKERLEELRNLADNWSRCDHLMPGEWAARLGVALDEITRLQRIKPAPTREEVRKALDAPLNGSMQLQNTGNRRSEWVIAEEKLAVAGLLREPERVCGAYWCKFGKDWFVCHWRDGRWLFERTSQACSPDEIGPRIPDPPK